ncbi:MAG: rcc01693 family protein [Pseudomonadota bacterium]
MTKPGQLLPWAALMRLGLHTLRLGAAEFWAMTPRELAVAAGLAASERTPSRPDLDALMARYPDAARAV